MNRECKCLDCGAPYLVPANEAPRGRCPGCEEIAAEKLRAYFRDKWASEVN
jgi:hypothetical protein